MDGGSSSKDSRVSSAFAEDLDDGPRDRVVVCKANKKNVNVGFLNYVG